ncbi:HNH endonuclease signature motif containing protein, partial [Mariniluteicoccus flavus]
MTTTPAPTQRELVTAVRENLATQIATESKQLALVALMCDAWALTSSPATDPRAEGDLPPSLLFGEQLLDAGADGTPQVAEFLSVELGPALQISPDAAWRLIGDVLNLRHRHPILWEHALTGRVRAWVARKIAALTAPLSQTDARHLDTLLARRITGATPAQLLAETERLLTLLDTNADNRRERARHNRTITISADGRTDGHAWLEGTLDATAAIHLNTTLDQTAHALKTGGMDGTHAELRSEALGLLAHPHRAHHLLDHALPLHDLPDITTGEQAGAEQTVATAASCCPNTGAAGQPGRCLPDPCRHGAELVIRVRERELHQGLGGVLDGFGPVTQAHLTEILAGCTHVTIRPVIDLHEPRSTDIYTPSPLIRWIVDERDQREMFPFSNRKARSRLINHDHTIPRSQGGTTDTGNLGPLSRRVHRANTHGNLTVEQPRPG